MDLSESYIIDVGGGVTARIPLAHRLSPRDAAEIEFAMITCSEGLGELGRAAVGAREDIWWTAERRRRARLEKTLAGLGVAASVPAVVAERIDRLNAALAERKEPEAEPEAPSDAEVRRSYYVERLDEANQRLHQAVVSGDRKGTVAAAEAKDAALQALEHVDTKAYLDARLTELALLEARRGGDLIIEEKVVETPALRNGRLHRRRGQQVMKRELVITQKVTARDGLETLATSHLTLDGEQRKNRDGSPMLPAIDRVQHVALGKYREIYDAADPERTLGAIDLAAVRAGRTTADPFERGGKLQQQRIKRVLAGYKVFQLEEKVALEILGGDADQVGRFPEKVAARALKALREVAGKGNTVRSLVGDGSANAAMVAALVLAADVLIDHFGL